MTGVIWNALLVAVGTAVGMIFKTKQLKTIGERIFQAFALFVMVMGISGALDLSNTYLILASIIFGVAFGEVTDLDGKFTKLGNFLQQKCARNGGSDFANGFIQASLLFCVGSMSVVGALQSGMDNNHTVLITKGILDCISAVTLTMGFGIGVGFSVIVIMVYEGLLTLFAGLLSPVLQPDIIAASAVVGNMFLIGMATNMLKITNLKVANFLPAMFVPMVYQAVMMIVSAL